MRSNRHMQRRNRRTGFTLIELLLVLMILVVLGSMAVSVLTGTQEQALRDAAKSQIGIFESAIDLYKFQVRKPPSSLEDLVQKPGEGADRWAGPYIKGSKTPVDPWGNPYRYAAEGKRSSGSYDVWSVGPDGQDGTADDIGNWDAS